MYRKWPADVTLQSPSWPNVFALGDVANLPTSKTGAAIRKRYGLPAMYWHGMLRGRA